MDEIALFKAMYVRRAYQTIYREKLDHLEDDVEPCLQFEETLCELTKHYDKDNGQVWTECEEKNPVFSQEPNPTDLDKVCQYLLLNTKEHIPVMEGLRIEDDCTELVQVLRELGVVDIPKAVIVNISTQHGS